MIQLPPFMFNDSPKYSGYIKCPEHNNMHNADEICKHCRWELQQHLPEVKEIYGNQSNL